MYRLVLHPLVFYPLIVLTAAAIVLFSLQPQSWPRPSAAVAADFAGGGLVLEKEAFATPAPDSAQSLTVVRDFWGRTSALRIAVLPGRAEPTENDLGVRILLGPESARALEDRPVFVDVSYTPSPINAASGLAVSLQGEGPTHWISKPIAPEPNTIRFALPARPNFNAIGLRALSQGQDQAYGLEITRIRIAPRGREAREAPQL